MKKFTLLAGLLLLVGCARPKPVNVFPLGVWYEGGVAEARDNVLPKDPKKAAPIYDRNFADIAAHHINVIVAPNTPPEHHQALLAAATAHHLLVIPELGLDGGVVGNEIRDPAHPIDPAAIHKAFTQILDPMKTSPAFFRLQLLDEPAGGEPIKHYAQVAEMLKQHDPKVKPFCCLAGVGEIREFAQAVHPDVIAFDFYPFGVAKPANDIPSIRDFENASAAAVAESRKFGADCWAVIQCHAITGAIRYPLPTEVRAMTWTALGTGAKGVFWFLYQTEHFTPSQIMDGLVDRDFNARPDWDEVGRLAEELSHLTPILQNLKPSPDEHATVIRRKSMYPMVDPAGRQYLLAVNVDPGKSQILHLSLKTTAARVLRMPDRKIIPSIRKNDTLTWHEEFAPGAGALYRVE